MKGAKTMRKVIKPAYMDPKNSVDLFDGDRLNQWGTMYCIAPAILSSEVAEYWKEYVELQSKDA